MALVDVKPYFRSVLDGLGLKEWRDGFNFENIPSTILDGSYHLTTGSVDGSPANQLAHRFDFPMVIRVFFSGFRDPASAIDAALGEGDNILKAALATATRLGGVSIKDVSPVSIEVLPLADSNDNGVMLVMEFNTNLYEYF